MTSDLTNLMSFWNDTYGDKRQKSSRSVLHNDVISPDAGVHGAKCEVG